MIRIRIYSISPIARDLLCNKLAGAVVLKPAAVLHAINERIEYKQLEYSTAKNTKNGLMNIHVEPFYFFFDPCPNDRMPHGFPLRQCYHARPNKLFLHYIRGHGGEEQILQDLAVEVVNAVE